MGLQKDIIRRIDMNKAKTFKLSWLLGLYLLISIIGISFGLLIWTYHNAKQAIDKELQGAFEQRHTIAEIILEYQIEMIHRQLRNISKNELLIAQVSEDDKIEAKKILYKILDANPDAPLDIAFISLSTDLVWLDTNAPFFDISPILPDIMDRQRNLLASGQILRIRKGTVDLTMILKAAPVIHNRTGKVLGTLFGGIVLNDNLAILEDIQQKTQTSVIVLLEGGEIIGSTDLLDAQSTRTLKDARDHRDSGQIYNANDLLISYNNISLSGLSTSLEIAMAIPDQSLHSLQHAYREQGIVLLLICLVFLSMTFLSLRWLIQPSLKKLMEYSASVSSGNLQARYRTGTITEFNQFGRAAERMVETIWMEIEERRQVEKALQILNTELDQRVTERTAQLETANQAKSAFLANMSHELRTPLNAILGFTQLIFRSPTIPDEHREHIELINRSGEHLLALINQVLDMSKIEAGRATLEPSAFDLKRLIAELEQGFRPRIESKGLTFRLDISSAVPHYVTVDETKLRQILINLLGNALKNTVKGFVHIKVDLAQKGQTTACQVDISDSKETLMPRKLCICVEDSGPGIADDELDHIFQAFVQTATGQQRQEGTGLGLALSKQLAHLLGGELTVQSTVGKGSVFVFEFPYQPAAADQVRQRPQVVALEPDQDRYRILVVDDMQSSRLLVADTLSGVSCADRSEPGFEIRQAANGAEAMDTWQRWQPHLIWMDMRMPVMDGYEATRRIKASDQGQATAVIGLSASAFEEDRAAVLEAGCDDFLRKPFRISDFFDMMHKHIGVRYVYIDGGPADNAPMEAPVQMELIADSLMKLPEAIRADLLEATEETNPIKIQSIIEQIAEQNQALATEIAKLAANFQFDVLRDMLEAEE